jgi:hypothetical protein
MSALQLNIQMSIAMFGFLQIGLLWIPLIAWGKPRWVCRIYTVLFELFVIGITIGCFFYFMRGRWV